MTVLVFTYIIPLVKIEIMCRAQSERLAYGKFIICRCVIYRHILRNCRNNVTTITALREWRNLCFFQWLKLYIHMTCQKCIVMLQRLYVYIEQTICLKTCTKQLFLRFVNSLCNGNDSPIQMRIARNCRHNMSSSITWI